MTTNTCSCQYKEQMIEAMQQMRKQHSGKDTEWIDLLFPSSEGSEDHPLCCLLTFLFYHGYCKECATPLSAHARSVLAPLMTTQESSVG